jgi:hypothetical protein
MMAGDGLAGPIAGDRNKSITFAGVALDSRTAEVVASVEVGLKRFILQSFNDEGGCSG